MAVQKVASMAPLSIVKTAASKVVKRVGTMAAYSVEKMAVY